MLIFLSPLALSVEYKSTVTDENVPCSISLLVAQHDAVSTLTSHYIENGASFVAAFTLLGFFPFGTT